MPEESDYHVPPRSTPEQRRMFALRISVAAIPFLIGLYFFLVGSLTLIARVDDPIWTRMPASWFVAEHMLLIIVTLTALPFLVVAYPTIAQQRGYRAGTVTEQQANRSMRTLLKASIIFPLLALIAMV
jgi:hypothetical protein